MQSFGVEEIAVCYLLAVNAITFIVFGIDKYKAVKGRWRVSEKALLIWAIMGGSVGALLGMMVWHHKTRHKKFYIGVPVIIMIQGLLYLACERIV